MYSFGRPSEFVLISSLLFLAVFASSALGDYHSAECPDGTMCPDWFECVNMTSTQYGCQYIQGPVCTDNPYVCPPGFHCSSGYHSNGTTFSLCESCNYGSYCPPGMGSQQPIVCPAGSFCPNRGMTAPILCPEGSAAPVTAMMRCDKCPYMFFTSNARGSRCDEMTPVMISLIVLASVLVLAGLYRCVRRCRAPKAQAGDVVLGVGSNVYPYANGAPAQATNYVHI